MNKKLSTLFAMAVVIGCAGLAFVIIWSYDLIPQIGEETKKIPAVGFGEEEEKPGLITGEEEDEEEEEEERVKPAASIKILSPQSPRDNPLILINGSSINIEWESENIGSTGIDIRLFSSSDAETYIVSDIPNTTKSYQWTIPQDIETSFYRIYVGTAADFYSLGSTFDFSDSFIISPTTLIEPIINSISLQEASIGSTIVITGKNFDPIGGTGSIGWATHSHVFVYMENSQGQKGMLLEKVWLPPEEPIAITIPSKACIYSRDMGGCSPISITPGQYLLSIEVHGRGISNEVAISIQ